MDRYCSEPQTDREGAPGPVVQLMHPNLVNSFRNYQKIEEEANAYTQHVSTMVQNFKSKFIAPTRETNKKNIC
jgi:hypothetical protein